LFHATWRATENKKSHCKIELKILQTFGKLGLIMPEICHFYGIVIAMFYNEYEKPHFHARYAEYTAQIFIEDFSIKKGKLPNRAYKLVKEWAHRHQAELLEMYNTKNIDKLPPLE
jgi:hypothetical protein